MPRFRSRTELHAVSLAAAERRSDVCGMPTVPATMAAILLRACGSATMALTALHTEFDTDLPFWAAVIVELECVESEETRRATG